MSGQPEIGKVVSDRKAITSIKIQKVQTTAVPRNSLLNALVYSRY